MIGRFDVELDWEQPFHARKLFIWLSLDPNKCVKLKTRIGEIIRTEGANNIVSKMIICYINYKIEMN